MFCNCRFLSFRLSVVLHIVPVIICVQTSFAIEDWAIEVELSDAFALSTGLSSIKFEVNGERLDAQCDALLSVLNLYLPTASHRLLNALNRCNVQYGIR